MRTALACAVIALISGCANQPSSTLKAETVATPARSLEDETAVFRLAEMCSEAAFRFWQRNGYEKWTGRSVAVSYTNHYNTALKRCLIETKMTVFLTNGDVTDTYVVLDAIEGGTIASLEKRQPAKETESTVRSIRRGGSLVDVTKGTISTYGQLMVD